MNKVLQLLRSNYVQILIIILTYTLLSGGIPLDIKNFLYSSSLFIKAILSWVLPFTVFIYIVYTVASFGKGALRFIIFLIIFEFASNFISIWYGYLSANIFSKIRCTSLPFVDSDSLTQNFSFPLRKPEWLSSDKGVFAGIVTGLMIRRNEFVIKMKGFADFVLTKIFSKLLPLFVLGIYANMHHKHMIQSIVYDYGAITLQLVTTIYLYIFLVYFIASGLNIRKTVEMLKNMLPAWVMGFTTGCSLSTMPLTISCMSKNAKDPELARGIIPATTNVQQVGDCIMMSFIWCFIYAQFYGELPSLYKWMSFSVLFTLARFTVTAVVGGAVFILLPLVESELNFGPEMISIFITLNMLFDPIVTSSNILGNGGLYLIFEKIFKKFTSNSVTK